MKKTCNRCEENLPLSDFYKTISNKDGYFNRCRKCVKARAEELKKEPFVAKGNSHHIQLWMPTEMHERIKDACRQKNITYSAMMREAINWYLLKGKE